MLKPPRSVEPWADFPVLNFNPASLQFEERNLLQTLIEHFQLRHANGTETGRPGNRRKIYPP